jgi:hypothetical protein
MTTSSGAFCTAAQLREWNFARNGCDWVAVEGLKSVPTQHPERCVPLYEAKMIHQFDHRFGYYPDGHVDDTRALPRPDLAQKNDPSYEVMPRFWVPSGEVEGRLADEHWEKKWLMGWRDITNSTNERTVIATVFPRVGVGNNLPLMFFGREVLTTSLAALIGNLSSLTCDFFARQKLGGTHLNIFTYQQLPILPPSTYTESDLALIVPRVLELTYTSYSMAPFAHDLGHDGPPFAWDEDRRAQLRAELEAWYARAYGLTRDELRYILDPTDVKGPDYPPETFRVLKKNEIARFGEYRTARLVLAAYDQLTKHPLAAE